MHVLLPPSEGKSGAAGAGRFDRRAPELLRDAQPVLDYLAGLRESELSRVYGIRNPKRAAAIHAQNLDIAQAPCLPALERYTGVVYANIGLDTLPARRHADKHLLIVSGMFGLIRGDACIPDYKLPLNPWLVRYWKSINSARLEKLARGRPVLSLLPQAHARAVEYAPLHSVDFRVAGGRKAAGHGGKAVKGKFVRYLMTHKATRIEEAAGFEEEGYRFDGANFVRS